MEKVQGIEEKKTASNANSIDHYAGSFGVILLKKYINWIIIFYKYNNLVFKFSV